MPTSVLPSSASAIKSPSPPHSGQQHLGPGATRRQSAEGSIGPARQPRSSPPSRQSTNGSIGHPRSPPPSGQPRRPRSSAPKRQSANGSTASGPAGPPSRSGKGVSFATLTTVVFIIALADVAYVWRIIHSSIGGGEEDGTPSHHRVGAEAGLHQLHEKNRAKILHKHVEHVRNKTITTTPGGTFVRARDNKLQKPHVDDRIESILKSAGAKVDAETTAKLPTWDDVVAQYGPSPIIYGLETCEPYRQMIPPEDRMVGPAGIFNTGTNLLFELMKRNCDIKEARNSETHSEPKKNGARWQAPWGKHNPVETHRFKNVAKMWGEGINHTAFFPVVTIKDPYHWMGSQCRHQYQTHWKHDKNNCPNLVDHKGNPERVWVRYAKNLGHYESLTDMWNKWYEEWEVQTFPHITTRFEDLLFHGEDVTKTVCDCVGGVFTKKFQFVEGSAKENGLAPNKGAYGLVKSLLQYGNGDNRLDGLTDPDRLYAQKSLNPALMKKYGYVYPPLPDVTVVME
ncbi:hypothetical protein ACHAWF_008409 [Thalassiosira exigua]